MKLPSEKDTTIKCEMDIGEPECKPLVNLEQILHWQNYITPSDVRSLHFRTDFSVCDRTFGCHCAENASWKPAELIVETTPRTLVCHDMRGGYIEDRFINGTHTDMAYRFFHWAGIDLFVYFSHNLLTIPPPGWISAGHLHGVKVLGTFITEWDAGEAALNQILTSDETRALYVEKMVDICEKFSFDGYLLNVENKLNQELVPSLKMFITELHKLLKLKLPNAELIWYDSIITDGSLKWQNELNNNNNPFFDLCDGILLNYPWNEVNLERSAKAAGSRTRDVFAGIDVFGRGSFGGGGFGSALAVEEARRHGLSAAFFAPGWTHEVLDGVHFACTEHLFWAHVRPFLFLRGPADLPIATSFCQGFGHKGRVHHGSYPSSDESQPWYHLASQRLQPTVSSCLDVRCMPKVETPKVEAPEVEAPKVVAPEGEAPEMEAPEVETPKVEPPKAEAPKEDAPAGDAHEGGGEGASSSVSTAPPPAPVVTPAPDCGGLNRGCVQHFEEDAFDGGGCLRIIRMACREDATSLHRVLVCDLVSSSGTFNIIYATKNFPDSAEKCAMLRLALVLRPTISSESKFVWVDDFPGFEVKRSKCADNWISVNSAESTNGQSSWKVLKHLVITSDHINEVLVGLPPGCNSALLGWLEINEN